MKGSMFWVMGLLGVLLMSGVVESQQTEEGKAYEKCKEETCPADRWSIRK